MEIYFPLEFLIPFLTDSPSPLFLLLINNIFECDFCNDLIFMHLTYLFFLGDPRYSMGCWLLSFIVLIYSCKIIYFPYLKAKFFQQNNKSV